MHLSLVSVSMGRCMKFVHFRLSSAWFRKRRVRISSIAAHSDVSTYLVVTGVALLRVR